MAPTLRPAIPDDLRACAEVCAASVADLARRQGRPPPPVDVEHVRALLAHGIRLGPGGFHVAEDDGQIVAFGAAWLRDGLWWLGFLFGLPGHHGGGIGKALLERALAPGADAPNLFTYASSEPAAMALYLRSGMLPRASVLTFSADVTPDAPDTHALAPLRRSSMAFERERFGFARGHDHRFLMETGARGLEVTREDGTRAGFLYVHPDGLVGPLAVEAPADVGPALDLAAREAGRPVTLRLPAPNEEAMRWCARHKARLAQTNLVMSRAPLAPLDLVALGPPALI